MSPPLVRTAALAVLVAAQVLLGFAVFAGRSHAEAAPAWGWPLAGEPTVDRGFEPPASAWAAGHRGVDLRGELGASVLAAGAGRVTYAGLLAGRGVITVTHDNGLRTTYEPVVPSLSVGASVALGDVLGTLDTGHGSCHPDTVCLHWGLLRGDTYLDPLALLSRGHLRLLPTGASPAADDAVARVPAVHPAPSATPYRARAAQRHARPRPADRAAATFVLDAADVATLGGVAYVLYLGAGRLRQPRRA